MKNIIFLDFDGVITNVNTKFQAGDPQCIAVLNEIVKRSGASVVISSTWRLFPDCDAKLYSWGFNGTIAGHTPQIQGTDRQIRFSASRGQEIATWLTDSNVGKSAFVIIDDEEDMGSLTPYLVKTDTNIGLTNEHISQVLEKLNL